MKYILCLILWLPVVAFGADPPPVPPVIRLPELPPAPQPSPTPGPVTKLTGSQLYVISADVEVLVTASRKPMVTVTKMVTPVTIFGNFVDGGTGSRAYAKGFVYVVQAAAVGEVELVINPDLTGANEVRRCLSVDNGTPPVPPPTPPAPPVPPTPPAPTDPLTKAFQVAYDSDVDSDKAADAAFLSSVYKAAPALLTPDVKTYADLFTKLSSVIHTPGVGFPKGKIPKLMAAVGAELNADLGTNAAAPIDAAKATAAFAKVADALGKVVR